jgi:hypothetical protein
MSSNTEIFDLMASRRSRGERARPRARLDEAFRRAPRRTSREVSDLDDVLDEASVGAFQHVK